LIRNVPSYYSNYPIYWNLSTHYRNLTFTFKYEKVKIKINMKNKKSHIKKEERFLIEKMLKAGKGVTEIARLLERGISSISEEISRNGGKDKYNSTSAHINATERQEAKKANQNKVSKSTKLQSLIMKYRQDGMSPEKISVLLKSKKQKTLDVSPKSIRKFLKHITI
jgi:IS30 family transposase